MKKFLLLFLFLISCNKKNNNDLFIATLFVGTSNVNLERIAYDNSKRLLSPLGQYEYRGLDEPLAVSRGGLGKYHYSEVGDATYQTGVYLSSLAWKYKNTKSTDVLSQIDKVLQYYESMQERLNGAIGRNYIADSAYQQLIPCERDGNYTGSDVSVTCGTYRYKKFNIDGSDYWLRYDISIDLVCHSLVGLHWTATHVPERKEKAISIMTKLLSYYRGTNWLIKDSVGTQLRYGDHTPTLNPVSWSNEAILLYWVEGSKKSDSYISTIANNIITYDGIIVKEEDRNFFNDYMLIKLFHVLSDIGYSTKGGINRLYNTHKNEYYFLTYSIQKIVNNDQNVVHVKDLSGFSLFDYHCLTDNTVNFIVPLDSRKTYSKWEFSPYRYCSVKQYGELKGNQDFLEAYWIQ